MCRDAYRDDTVCNRFLQCTFSRLLQFGQQHSSNLLDAEHFLLLHVKHLKTTRIWKMMLNFLICSSLNQLFGTNMLIFKFPSILLNSGGTIQTYFYTGGSRGHLCQIIHQVRLGCLDIRVSKSPAMEFLEALYCVFIVGHHLDTNKEAKQTNITTNRLQICKVTWLFAIN